METEQTTDRKAGRSAGRAGSWDTARAALAALLLAAGTPAMAQTTGGQPGAWQFEITPYFWAAGMKGDVQIGTLPKMGVDMDFSKIADNLDFGLMGALEARKGRWGLLFDVIYMDLSMSAVASRTGPGPIGATATAHAELGMQQTVLAAAAAYRVAEGASPVDLIGGLRYVKLEADANIVATFFALTGFVSRSGDKEWVEPYIGLRVKHPLSERWTAVGYADIGGFGVGSDFTWQALAGLNYDFTKSVSGKFGYRYFAVDYDRGGFLYEMDSGGPYAGVGIRF